jgi:hypothetical protein
MVMEAFDEGPLTLALTETTIVKADNIASDFRESFSNVGTMVSMRAEAMEHDHHGRGFFLQ